MRQLLFNIISFFAHKGKQRDLDEELAIYEYGPFTYWFDMNDNHGCSFTIRGFQVVMKECWAMPIYMGIEILGYEWQSTGW